MSRSGGVNVSKTGLIRGFIAAITICVCFIGYGLWESAKYERHADNQRAEYAKYTRQKIAKACVGLSSLEAVKCQFDAKDAQRENEYNQRDLVAQRSSALWAYIMGAAAVIGMALSAFGVWLVKATFDESKEGNRLTQSIGEATARAHIAIQSAKVTISSTSIIFEPTLRNVGNTAAVDVAVEFFPEYILTYAETEDDLPSYHRDRMDFKNRIVGVVNPQSSVPLSEMWWLLPDDTIANPKLIIERVSSQTGAFILVFRGKCEWQDVFFKNHEIDVTVIAHTFVRSDRGYSASHIEIDHKTFTPATEMLAIKKAQEE
ncbi:MAG: hypothetical protein ABI668_07970 [Sphingorhabdus sp.]